MAAFSTARLALFLLPWAATAEKGLGCTALAIDGAASIDGTAFAVENTDCNDCDFRLNYVAPGNHAADATRPLYQVSTAYPRYVGYGRGDMYHPKPGQKPSERIGSIPQVPHTFGYYESISPLMNDQGLGLGESSCSANLQNKLPNSSEKRAAPIGTIDAATMMQLALERCATASCAIDVMGDLSERYGYLPYGGEPTEDTINGRTTWADSGEAYTIADASGEAWVLNMMGGVLGVTKSVWAARRVPKGHLAVVANEFTLGEIPAEQNEEYRFNAKIHEAAIAAGLWDGKGALDFSRVFAPDPTAYHGKTQPIPMYSSIRRWRILSLAAPSLGLQVKFDQRDYPFSVKVESPLSHRDVMAFMKDHYADTEFDMTQGVLAGPYRTPFRVEGGPKPMGDVPRGISILRTLYSTVTQTGPGTSVLWWAPDTPATSVFVPLEYRTGDSVSTPFASGHNRAFTRKSAWWAFGFVNNWMQLNYQGMSTEDVLPRIEAWQDRIDEEFAKHRHESPHELRQWQVKLQEAVVADWWKLADMLVMKWNDMSRTSATKTDVAVGYPQWWADMIGFSNDIHPVWVQPASAPPASCQGTVKPSVALPATWSAAKEAWDQPFRPLQLTSIPQIPQRLAEGAFLLGVGVVVGFFVGKHRAPAQVKEDYLRLA